MDRGKESLSGLPLIEEQRYRKDQADSRNAGVFECCNHPKINAANDTQNNFPSIFLDKLQHIYHSPSLESLQILRKAERDLVSKASPA